jgi:surface antigen
MFASTRKFGFKATAIALVAATGMTIAAPAFAGGRHHGGGGGGWGWSSQPHHGGGYSHGYSNGYHDGRDDGDDALAAVAIVGGVLLGAALLSSASQPSYYTPPPQTVYAPAPAYGSSYGYNQAPVQAVPASDVYQTQSGQYCREYQSQANIGGQMTYGYGTACLQPDGSWRVAN